MKESYNEGVASHIGPEPCLDDPRGRGGSVGRGKHRRAIELRKHDIPEAELVAWREGNTGHRDKRAESRSGGVEEPGMCGHFPHENRETSGRSLHGREAAMTEATGKVNSRTPVVGSPEESDGVIVPEKSANKGATVPAESMEERMPTKRKLDPIRKGFTRDD